MFKLIYYNINNIIMEKKLNIYIVFHNKFFEEMYEELDENEKKSITLYGVKNKQDTTLNIIYESELEIYNDNLQKNIYNESTCFYHVYMNKLYKNYDYIGFGQYDMKLHKNSINDIQHIINNDDSNNIFIMGFFPDLKEIGFQGAHTLIKQDLNTLKCGLDSYNEFFNKNYSLEQVINNRLILCNTFIIKTNIFEKMMSWLISYFVNDISTNLHPLIGNAGSISEGLIGMFLSLELYEEGKYVQFNIEHIWPLYKSIANSS
jgi:hypothetical protein